MQMQKLEKSILIRRGRWHAVIAYALAVSLPLNFALGLGYFQEIDRSDFFDRYVASRNDNDRLTLEKFRLEIKIEELQRLIDDLTPKKAASELPVGLTVEAIGRSRAQEVFYGCMAMMSRMGPIRDRSTGYLDYALWNCQRGMEWYVSHPFDVGNPFFPFDR